MKTVIEMALEALEDAHHRIEHKQDVTLREKAITALREALAEQPAQSTAEKSELEAVPANGGLLPAQQEPDRVKFERHWRKTRGDKKANRELPRHPLQPQTYIQDSANRHWVTWQAAVRSVAPQAQRTWVGLTEDDKETPDMGKYVFLSDDWIDGYKTGMKQAEAKLKEKNA